MLTKADITLAKSLGDKKSRLESGLFVCEGSKIVGELPNSGLEIVKIYSTIEREGAILVSNKEMERMSQLKNASDCLALVKIPNYNIDYKQLNGDLVLALDDVQDPGNVGTIIRLADWFGIKDILCSRLSADCFNPKVVQATMGAILRVRLHYVDLQEALTELSTPIYGTFLEGDNIYNTNLSSKGVIVMGNEGRGISKKVENLVSNKLYIPPFPEGNPTSESLNVATATAIICSEFRRRK